MKREEGTYTIQDLADLSGVNPRTIHFYISRGLLEGVGRRGPGSRYPEGHLHRLIFIRELQARARLSLEEIAKVLAGLPPETIESVALGREPLAVAELRRTIGGPRESPARRVGISSLFSSRHEALLEPILREDAGDEPAISPPGAPPASARSRAFRFFSRNLRPPESPGTARREALEGVLQELSTASRRPDSLPPPREGSWVSIHVGDDLTLSARGMSPEELRILEQIGQTIAEILNRARSEADEKE